MIPHGSVVPPQGMAALSPKSGSHATPRWALAIALALLALGVIADALTPQGQPLTMANCRARIQAALAAPDAGQRNLAFIALVGSLNDVLQGCHGAECEVASQCLREAMAAWPQPEARQSEQDTAMR